MFEMSTQMSKTAPSSVFLKNVRKSCKRAVNVARQNTPMCWANTNLLLRELFVWLRMFDRGGDPRASSW